MILSILPGMIIGFREGLEAFLIIVLMLEYLKKLNRSDLFSSVIKGMYSGLFLSFILGIILWALTGLMNGSSAISKLWESLASLTAVIFISYFIYWMIKHGKGIAEEIKNSVELNLSAKGLFLLAMVAVAREGAEISLFAFAAENKTNYLSGNLTGVILAALLAFLIYKSLVKVNIGLIFRITLFYLILQAAYLSGYAVHEFISALKTLDLIDGGQALFVKVYNFQDTILDHKTGYPGIFLNVIFGWYSRPEWIQFISQIAYLITGFSIWKKISSR